MHDHMGMETSGKFLSWLAQCASTKNLKLHGPGSAASIASLELLTRKHVPPTLKALWLAHDGQDTSASDPVFEGFWWLSVAGAQEEAASMTEVLLEVSRENGGDERWLPEWLPFGIDGMGGMLVVDVAKGDIFEWHTDGNGREATRGASFDAFIDAELQSPPNERQPLDAQSRAATKSAVARAARPKGRLLNIVCVVVAVLFFVGYAVQVWNRGGY